ncbi:glycosyltransferase [Limimaricola soesokkakensis]|nr:glycosyltransferase [Limimaricola soesokkakensis]
MLALTALRSDDYDEVVCFVLSRGNSGTLAELAAHPKCKLIYANARSEKYGLFALAKVCWQSNYSLAFSSFTHLNAALSFFKKVGILKSSRLVTRESTMIFERDLGFKGALVKKLYYLYGGQDSIVCQTERMESSLNLHTHGKLQAKTVTIPNPVNPLPMVEEPPADPFLHIPRGIKRIAWCGRLSKVKSPHRAIETIAALHALGRHDIHLIMIGDGPLRTELTALIEMMELEAFVSILGYQDNPMILMAACDVGLVTSDVEGFPNVILEMLASGTQGVVTTNCAGGLDEIPGVSVAAENSCRALAEAINQVLSVENATPNLSEFLSERAPQRFYERILGR